MTIHNSDWMDTFSARGNPLNKVLWDHGRIRRTSGFVWARSGDFAVGDEIRFFHLSSSWLLDAVYLIFHPIPPAAAITLGDWDVGLYTTGGAAIDTGFFYNAISLNAAHDYTKLIYHPDASFNAQYFHDPLWKVQNPAAGARDPMQTWEMRMISSGGMAGDERFALGIAAYYLAGD